jgi:hypothetical protein
MIQECEQPGKWQQGDEADGFAVTASGRLITNARTSVPYRSEKLNQTFIKSYCNLRALAFGTVNQSNIVSRQIDSVVNGRFGGEIGCPATVSALAYVFCSAASQSDKTWRLNSAIELRGFT